MRYEKVPLDRDEKPAKINMDTGEISLYEKRQGGNFNNTKLFIDKPFQRVYIEEWNKLDKQLSTREFMFTTRLSRIAQPFTNSLKPYGPKSTTLELAEAFQTDRRYINAIIKKLIKLNVIAVYKANDIESAIEKHLDGCWIFNPYLSFNGSVINKNILNLFK